MTDQQTAWSSAIFLSSQEILAVCGNRSFISVFTKARRLYTSWARLYCTSVIIGTITFPVSVTLLHCLITQTCHSRHMSSKLFPMFVHVGYSILCKLFLLPFKRKHRHLSKYLPSLWNFRAVNLWLSPIKLPLCFFILFWALQGILCKLSQRCRRKSMWICL
jgi:hypothetical protein